MKYELRKLCSKDIFPMSKILSKIGFSQLKSALESDEVKKLTKGDKSNINVEAVGMTVMLDIGGIILANLSSCEEEIYKLLADLTGASVEELKGVSLVEFAELIIALVKKEEFSDFIGVVSRLFSAEE